MMLSRFKCLHHHIKRTIVWDVTPYSLAVYRRFEEMYSLHLQGRRVSQAASSFDPKDRGSTFLRNVGKLSDPEPHGSVVPYKQNEIW
jgi:hypothetical protein